MSNKKRKPHASQQNYSGIERHKLVGKTLTSPWNTFPHMKPTSWKDERLPEYLWACILISCIPREQALATFRSVISYIEKKSPIAYGKITHTGLSVLDTPIQNEIISIITSTPENREVLQSLLLFDYLPARESWKSFLPHSTNINISPLVQGVAKTLNHQSQQSTDCRWLWVMTFLLTRKLIMHDKELIDGYLYYPDHGDLRHIRPSIRAMEIGLYNEYSSLSDWPTRFWQEALDKTECYQFPSNLQQVSIVPGTTNDRVSQVYQAVRQHMKNTLSTTAIDSKHDTAFGISLYCLSILNELLRLGNSTSILGRLGLRTILECFITSKYLVLKNDESLWQSFRVYGAGQAKLSFIKLDELDDSPKYVDKVSLEQLANEDMWLEYLNIYLGHWDNINLRTMSDVAEVKEYYDKYHGWTSSFVHGQWGAVRDTVFETCGNPLHRLHRISRENPRMLPDVIFDACLLTDKVLEILSNLYPTFNDRVTISPPSP